MVNWPAGGKLFCPFFVILELNRAKLWLNKPLIFRKPKNNSKLPAIFEA